MRSLGSADDAQECAKSVSVIPFVSQRYKEEIRRASNTNSPSFVKHIRFFLRASNHLFVNSLLRAKHAKSIAPLAFRCTRFVPCGTRCRCVHRAADRERRPRPRRLLSFVSIRQRLRARKRSSLTVGTAPSSLMARSPGH